MFDAQVQTFLAQERAKEERREIEQRQRAARLARRERIGEALRPLLELLPLSGPAARRTPFDDQFRQDLCDALLKVGAVLQGEGLAHTVKELSVTPSAQGCALQLLQKAAAGDTEGIAGDL